MKTMKRIIGLICALSMAFALAACGETEDIAQTLTDAQTKATAAGSMEGDMVMDMSISVTAGEGTEPQSTDTVMKMHFVAFNEPMKVKASVDMSDLLGQTGAEPAELTVDTYVVEKDGVYTVYTNAAGEWTTETLELGELGQLNPQDNLQMYIDNATSFKKMGEETLEGGVKAVKYSGIITSESLDKVMEASGMAANMSQMGMDLDWAALYKEMGDMPISIWIDGEGYPVRYEMDMTQMMNTVFSRVMEQLGDAATGYTMTATKVYISMNMFNYGTATDFELPPEAAQ
jgi:hypothetical protein